MERPVETSGGVSRDKIQQMLDEVSTFEVDLEPDPTQPHLGTKYLQEALAKCRAYLNRVQYYMGLARMYERTLRVHVHELELNIDFKTKEMLADDVMVRKQPSIEDRRALAAMSLRTEFEELHARKADLLDVEESVKLLKHKYDHLKGTSQDVKMQRNLVRDDMQARMVGEDGYDKPQTNQDRTIPGGLRAPVTADSLDPRDLLSPDAAAETPRGLEAKPAEEISRFFQQSPPIRDTDAHEAPTPRPTYDDAGATGTSIASYDDLLT